MSEALSPSEIVERHEHSIPNEVIDIFNELIKNDYTGVRAVVFQDDVLKALEKKGFKREDVFEKRWLDVEGIYKKKGWKVAYDRPGYNETGRAYFEFVAKG